MCSLLRVSLYENSKVKKNTRYENSKVKNTRYESKVKNTRYENSK